MTGMRIWSAVPGGSGATRVHEQLAQGIPGYCLKTFSPRREYFPLSLLSLRNPAAPIVHVSPDHGALLAAPNQRMVVTFHNFVLDDDMRRHSSLVQRLHYRTDLRLLTGLALRRAAVITAVSDYTAGLVSSFFSLSEPIRVIPNGIDTEAFSPGAEKGSGGVFRVLVSGNASRRKGTHLIPAIAARLAPGIEILCTLDKDELHRWVGDIPNVKAMGKRGADEMPALYQSADVLLMPTAREGFGLAVAEAMSCALPVVASDRSTMPELVVHGKGGFLCSLDSPEEFAERINELALQPAMRLQMGEFNRRRIIERYSLKVMLDGYRELFDEMLEVSSAQQR